MERRRQAQPGQTNNYVDGDNRVVRMDLCSRNKEGTRQELLAATHCMRLSNGWNMTTTTKYVSRLIVNTFDGFCSSNIVTWSKQELLAATHCMRLSNGWNMMTTTEYVCLP